MDVHVYVYYGVYIAINCNVEALIFGDWINVELGPHIINLGWIDKALHLEQ